MRKNDHLPIFVDTTGNRFRWLLWSLLLVGGLLGIILLAGYWAVWQKPDGYLSKFGDDTNFTVIDKISTEVPNKIWVEGEGTFVGIKRQEDKTKYQLQKSGVSDSKTVILTFDDGPNPDYTPRLLEILKSENVPASFFVIGENVYRHPQITRQIVDYGMEIGNHTFTHLDKDFVNYKEHNGTENMDFELNFTQNAIQDATGVKTTLFRAPFWGTENAITLNSLGLTTFALDKGYTVSAPTQDSDDWTPIPPERIVANSVNLESKTVVLLLHDAGGYRENTVLALPEIIKRYKDAGYSFKTLGDLYGSSFHSEPGKLELLGSKLSVFLYNFQREFPQYLNPIMIFGLVFSLVYGVLTVFLSLVETVRRRKLLKNLTSNYSKQVTVLIPAFNEEKVIAKTIKSVLKSDYMNLKVLVIDDGSTDRTYQVASGIKDRRLKVLHKTNGGKHSALNHGLRHVRSEFYISIDADTLINPNAITYLTRFFGIPSVGAVGGNVKVGNRKNLWGILQSIEYTLSLNLERNAFSLLNSILVVPGALGAWRTSAVKKIGGYWGSTMTEDAELTLRILKYGYRVLYDKDAIAYTEAPQSFVNLVRQRFRWNYGVFQTFYMHKNLLFKKNGGVLGNFILPFTIFVQIPLMILTPIMDVVALSYLLFVSLEMVEFYLVVYLVIRLVLGGLAYAINKEMPWPLLFIPFVRFVYQPALYVPLYLAVYKVFRGTQMDWLKLSRYNSVNLKTSKFYQVEYHNLKRKKLKPPSY